MILPVIVDGRSLITRMGQCKQFAIAPVPQRERESRQLGRTSASSASVLRSRRIGVAIRDEKEIHVGLGRCRRCAQWTHRDGLAESDTISILNGFESAFTSTCVMAPSVHLKGTSLPLGPK
jgi:hypothetical protein